jgi:hypothetical protein
VWFRPVYAGKKEDRRGSATQFLDLEVADVQEGTGTDQQAHGLTLDQAGGRHMALGVMAGITIITGLVSFVLGMIVRNAPSASAALHVTATVTGGISLVLGLYAQMISTTRNQRIVIVTGMIAGFVGICLGLAHGGFSG